MEASKTFAQYYGITYRVINWQIDGLTHEDSLLQPQFRGNCLNWVLGHILTGREPVLIALGEAIPWNNEEVVRYKPDSEPITDVGNALTLERLQSALEESQTRILAGLQHASEEFLRTPVEEETVGEKIAFAHWHETYHVGQLELLRQLAGKNDKVI
jgi:uncharacterized damage-inducible protein DinB